MGRALTRIACNEGVPGGRTHGDRARLDLSEIVSVKRIAIIGCPGSGKTWLARRISIATGLPHHCLDDCYWSAAWKRPSDEDWANCVAELVKGEKWVIDGNYLASMRARVRAADLVIFLDLPTPECLKGVLRRFAAQLWRPECALPRQVHQHLRLRDRFYLDPALLQFVWRFSYAVRPRVLAELATVDAATRVLVLHSRPDLTAWATTSWFAVAPPR